MQSGKIITISVWLMIFFNLTLTFASIWSLQRMNPGIRQIFERNVISLSACEEMLAALATDEIDFAQFRKALEKAKKNITESGEMEGLEKVEELFRELETGKTGMKKLVSAEILRVTNFNREAIIQSARQAQKIRQAGAWGIVFMSLIFFAVAIFFEQKLRRTLLAPLQEISQVMDAKSQGDNFRRCNMLYANSDMKKLFTAINSLLDKKN